MKKTKKQIIPILAVTLLIGIVPGAHARSKFSAARSFTADGPGVSTSSIDRVPFDEESFDTDGAATQAGGGNNYKFTALSAGKYRVSAHVTYASHAAAAGDFFYLFLFKNNDAASTLDREWVDEGVTRSVSLVGTDTISLAANDYIDIRTSHDAGSTLYLSSDGQENYVSIERIVE